MSAMPSRARCGPFVYRITTDADEWEQSKHADLSQDYGYTDHERGVILIHPATTLAMRRVVLLHELMHAAAFAGGNLDRSKRREEDWVRSTAPMLLDALRRSPDLAAYLLSPEARTPEWMDSLRKEAPTIRTAREAREAGDE